MIRYVHIGDQIYEDAGEFAFYDTVICRFISIDGQDTFASREDLEIVARHDAPLLERLLPLVPEPEAKPTVQQLRERLKSWVRSWESIEFASGRSISDFITDQDDEFIVKAFADLTGS